MKQRDKEQLSDDEIEMKLFDEDYIIECFDNGIYNIIELVILKSLYKYVFLDKKTLHEAADCYLKPSLQKPDYRKNINNLIGNTISKINYTENMYDGKKKAEIAVYHLTTLAHNFVKEKYPKFKSPICNITKKPPLSMYDEYYIKERLLVNRWHLYMLSQYTVTRETYCGRKMFAAGRVSIPSCVCIKEGGGLNVIAVAYPREGKAYEQRKKRFQEKIKEIKRVTAYSLSRQIIIIALCHSMSDMEYACRYLKGDGEGIVYAIEADIVMGNGMRRLYGCTISEEGDIEKKFMNVAPKDFG